VNSEVNPLLQAAHAPCICNEHQMNLIAAPFAASGLHSDIWPVRIRNHSSLLPVTSPRPYNQHARQRHCHEALAEISSRQRARYVRTIWYQLEKFVHAEVAGVERSLAVRASPMGHASSHPVRKRNGRASRRDASIGTLRTSQINGFYFSSVTTGTKPP
jgi:hypothetical protein